MKPIHIIIAFLLIPLSSYGQTHQMGFNFEGGVSYGLHQINTDNSAIKVNPGSSFQLNLHTTYFISPYIGVGSGVSFGWNNAQLSLEGYQEDVPAVDSEGEAYILQITAQSLEDHVRISNLSIPVFLSLAYPISDGNISLFGNLGVTFNLPMATNYQLKNGTVTSRGWYPQYELILKDIPAHGLHENRDNWNYKSDLETQAHFNALLELGLKYKIPGASVMSLSIFAQKGLTAFHQNELEMVDEDGAFPLMNEVEQYNGIINQSTKSTSLIYGIKIGVNFPASSL
ncbi:outer membrane beta-barrel protein [Persicobacter diffluens]|uniref:Outer membrane protein beta-barrel domain-containing protein n=1 Tax=Persicobacter diffluens TaxID=981 RepID=A0AAN4VYU1_9BACT|nr:hypothetical protein PEDI_31230 [Persicobacter diffluens]